MQKFTNPVSWGDRIAAVGKNLQAEFNGAVHVETIDGTDFAAVPGFIDSHEHIMGGGGEGARHLDLIERVVHETEIPVTQFLPTLINRNSHLFEAAVSFAREGGCVDFTGNEDIDSWEKITDEVRVCAGIRRLLFE